MSFSPLPPVNPDRPVRPFRTKKQSKKQLKSIYIRGLAISLLCGTAAVTGYYYQSIPTLTAAKEPEIVVDTPEVAEAEPTNLPIFEETTETPPAPAVVATNASQNFPLSMELEVVGGDTLLNILTDTGVTYEDAYGAVQAIRKIYDPKKLDVGQNIAVSLDPSTSDPRVPVLSSLSFPISQTTSVHLVRDNSGEFAAKKIEAPLQKVPTFTSGTINSSLYETGMSMGLPAGLINELIKVYSYDVDFQRDIKRGNRLEVVVEKLQTEDGKTGGYGGLLYAQLNLGDKVLPIYRYTDKSGNTDYYNQKGESLRKALLRTPINGARISSGFGMRHHPVLGYSKMHRGVDFAAATGTPIYAAGDGVISFAGAKGGYGNYVQIKHNDKYATAYGHASRIAPGIKPGVKVRQGQVVAYVGSTGQSTGPHLHYEILLSGTQINPSGVKFKTGNSLSGRDLASFKANVNQVQALMKSSADKNKVASVENTTKKISSN